MGKETVDGVDDEVDDATVDPPVVDDTETPPDGEPTPGEPAAEDLGVETANLSDLSDEEFEALTKDPAKLRTAVMMGRDYQKKTTELANLRNFAEEFSRDPTGTVRKLAGRVGVKVAEEAPTPAATDAVAEAHAQLAEVMGKDAADRLIPLLNNMVQRAIEPLKATTDHVLGQTASTQAEAVMDAFTAKVPGWRKLEKEMVAISQEFQPVKGTDPLKFMERLHILASQGASRADQARDLTTRVTASVRGADTRKTGAPSSRVSETPNRLPTFDEAWNAGKAGKRLEF